MIADTLPMTVCWFETAFPSGPAIGDPECTTWGAFAAVFERRREGEKDGPSFVPAMFRLEVDGRHVRRLKNNLTARTAIALDIETNSKTGEVPPSLDDAMNRIKALGLAAIGYTSHNHKPDDARYRLVLPLSMEISHDLPAPEVLGEKLNLAGVLDRSKVGTQSLFYLPSAPPGGLDLHQTVIARGAPLAAPEIAQAAEALLAARQAEADRIATAAHAEAEARRQVKLETGFNPDDSFIEKIRSRFGLDSVLRGHGYDKSGAKYRHPNSTSRSYGADIRVFGGIERVFSHNANDPLHANNLPAWCIGVTAIDAFDAVVILDYGGDRPRAVRELAQRFGLTKAAERKAVAKLLFRMIRQQAPQAEIERATFTEGERLGLTREEVCQVAVWVVKRVLTGEAA